MELIIALLFLCYCILVLLLMIGWHKVVRQKLYVRGDIYHFISVIVPARNEEQHIVTVLQSLQNQSYSLFEIIVVDDHSSDQTIEHARRFALNDMRIKILTNEGSGKKQALATGIKAAAGAIIVTSDADCSMKVDWLTAINNIFCNEQVKLAFGSVRIKDDQRLFSQLQQLEFCSLIGSAAATAALGFPTMCNGANLAFRKTVFYEVGGHDDHIEIPSGDDEFLLRKVARAYPTGIQFMKDKNSIVTTEPQQNVNNFLHQRIRWAGKWKYHQSLSSKVLAVFVFLFQLSSIVSFILIFTGNANILLALLCFSKILLELIFLRQINFFSGHDWRWTSFILLQFIYPFYVVYVGLVSNFKSFEWKGRILKSNQSR